MRLPVSLSKHTLTVAGVLVFGSPSSYPLCHRPNDLMAEEGISVVLRFRKPLSQPCSRKQISVVVSRASVCLVCLGFQIDNQRAWMGGSGSALLESEKSSRQNFTGKVTGHLYALALVAL